MSRKNRGEVDFALVRAELEAAILRVRDVLAVNTASGHSDNYTAEDIERYSKSLAALVDAWLEVVREERQILLPPVETAMVEGE